MGVRMIRLKPERRFVMFACARHVAAFPEHVRQIHVARGVVRMRRNRFRVSGSCRCAVSGAVQETAQIIEGEAMGGGP